MRPMSDETRKSIEGRKRVRYQQSFTEGDPQVVDVGDVLFQPRLYFTPTEELLFVVRRTGVSASVAMDRTQAEMLKGALAQYLHFSPNDFVGGVALRGEGRSADVVDDVAEVEERTVLVDVTLFGLGGNVEWTSFFFRNETLLVRFRTPTKWLFLLYDRLTQLFRELGPPEKAETHYIGRGDGPGATR